MGFLEFKLLGHIPKRPAIWMPHPNSIPFLREVIFHCIFIKLKLLQGRWLVNMPCFNLRWVGLCTIFRSHRCLRISVEKMGKFVVPTRVEFPHFTIIPFIPIWSNYHTTGQLLLLRFGNDLLSIMSCSFPTSRIVRTTHEGTSKHEYASC